MTAPDRITAWGDKTNIGLVYKAGPCPMDGMALFPPTEYVRADLARSPLAEALAVPTDAEVNLVAKVLHAQRNSLVHWDTMSPGYRGEFQALARDLFRALSALRAIGEPRNG